MTLGLLFSHLYNMYSVNIQGLGEVLTDLLMISSGKLVKTYLSHCRFCRLQTVTIQSPVEKRPKPYLNDPSLPASEKVPLLSEDYETYSPKPTSISTARQKSARRYAAALSGEWIAITYCNIAYPQSYPILLFLYIGIKSLLKQGS